jgi:hypothetical protein
LDGKNLAGSLRSPYHVEVKTYIYLKKKNVENPWFPLDFPF